MAHDVFISYSSIDQKIVEGLSAYLEQHKIRCFVAYRDIPPGIVWAKAITEAIENCKIMVIVFSKYSNLSDQVDREIELCSEEKKPILTFKIDNAVFSGAKKYYLKNINWIDAFPDPDQCFSKLLESIQALLGKIFFSSSPSSSTMTEKYITEGKNEEITYFENVELEMFCEADEFGITIFDKYGFKDKATKQIVIQARYEKTIGYFAEGLTAVMLNEKWGFIDKTGKEIIPFKYEAAFAYSQGLARVKLNNKWGFIDKTGKKIISFKYDDAQIFSEGLATVKLNDKWGFINKAGEEIIPVKYDETRSFREGLVRVKLNDKYGFIDKTGNEVIPLIYDWAESFKKGKTGVSFNDENFHIDKSGNRI